MTYIPSPSRDFALFEAPRTETKAPVQKKPSLWRRLVSEVWAARQRQADAEIARYLRHNGGRLTNSAEREIMDRLTRGGGNFRPV